jgi:hypothetical protein
MKNKLKFINCYIGVIALICFYAIILIISFFYKNTFSYDMYYVQKNTYYWAGEYGLEINKNSVLNFYQEVVTVNPDGSNNDMQEPFFKRNPKNNNMQFLSKDFVFDLQGEMLKDVKAKNGKICFEISDIEEEISFKIVLKLTENTIINDLTISHNDNNIIYEVENNDVCFTIPAVKNNIIHLKNADYLYIKSLDISDL